MKKFQLGILAILLSVVANAQLTGVKTIPGDYATLAAAITALNTSGVGSGGVTFELNAAETAPAGGYLIGSAVLNGTTGAANPIVFNGNNNILTSFAGTNANADAVIRVAGTDYVTINQFQIVEAGTNTTTTTQMERGIWACLWSQNDAPQNLLIQNCNINLNGTVANGNETGILVHGDLYTSTALSTTLATAPTLPAGSITNVTIRSNTVNNCFAGIVVRGNVVIPPATVAFFASGVTIGGNSALDGNTLINVGLGASGSANGIWTVNVTDINISYNTISSTTSSATNASINGIQCGLGGGFKTVNNNDISLQITTAASSSAINGIIVIGSTTLGYPSNTDININNNNLHDFTHGGTGTVTLLSNTTTSASGSNNILNNTISNFNRTGANGQTTAISSANYGTGTRSVSFNTITNIQHSATSGATLPQIIHGINVSANSAFQGPNPGLSSQNGVVKGNTINNISMTGTFTAAHTCYAIVDAMNFGTIGIDSNKITNITLAVPVANVAGIYGTTLVTHNVSVTRNVISGIAKTVVSASAMTIDGITFLGTAGSKNIINNMISNITCTTCHLDNIVRGVSVTGAVQANIYHNTIYLGSAGTMTSTGANFGVSGVVFSLGALVDLRNNIIHVNATKQGNGIIAAFRSADAGTSGTLAPGYLSTSNNNIFYAPNASSSFLYAEGIAGGPFVNSYNLTNDPTFNTGCGVFKAFAGGRETASFTESNLSSVSANMFAPSGNSFAESGGIVLANVTTDINNVARSTPPDMGALEFSGIVTDAAPPSITYTAPYYSFLCGTLPTITANISDVSGINTASGTKPRMYYKKTGDADTYAGNTSANNGWKYVEASNSVSPFTFTFDGAILQTPPAVADILQFFIIAQDNAAIPNVALNSVAFASGYCPSTVDLTSSAFPTQGFVSINSILMANYGNTTLVPVSNPVNVCFNGSTSLTVSDTIVAPGIMPTGYYNPTTQITGTTLDDIRRVQVAGSSLNNLSTCAGTGSSTINGLPGSLLNRYSNYTSTATPITLNSGTTYTVNIDIANCSSTSTSTAGVAVFLDINRNGTFETGERFSTTTLANVPANNATVTAIINNMTIPTSGVVNGPTLMRVISATSSIGNTYTPTSVFASGEVEDYQVYMNTSTVQAVNSLASSMFTWTPSANISTNPNRTVTANNITSSTVYTVTSTDGGGCTASTTILVNMATPIIAGIVTGTTSYCDLPGSSTTLTVAVSNGSTPFTSSWAGGPVVSTTGLQAVVNPPVGTTTYTVTVTDACGTTSTTTVNVTVHPIPTLTVTPGTGPACSGVPSVQTANGSGAPGLTYSWMPGNLNGTTQSLSPTIVTTYTVTSTSANGCSKTSVFALTPSTTPSITSITPSPTLACAGDSVQITTVTNPASGLTFNWTPTTNMNNPTAKSPKAAPFAPTTYTVTATNTAGCSKTGNVLVNVHPLISGTASVTPGVICAGGTSVVSATVPTQCGGTTAGFQQGYAPANWTLTQSGATTNGQVITTGAPTSIQLKSGTCPFGCGASGEVNYTTTVGCSGTITFNWSYSTADYSYSDYPRYKINNVTYPFPGFDTTSADQTQAGSFTVSITGGSTFSIQMYSVDNDPITATLTVSGFSGPAAPVNGTANVWTALTGGTNLGAAPYTASPATTTKYYIAYTQTGTGCINPFRDSVEVTVNPLPNITAGANPGLSVCSGNPVTLQGAGGNSYTWNGTPTLGSDTTLTPAVAGTYTVVGTDANGCSNSSNITISINALPTVTANASPASTVCLGDSVTLQGGGAIGYTWNGAATSGSDTTLVPAVAGTYTIVGTDANGCTNSATTTINTQSVTLNVSASPSNSICDGNNVTLQANGASTYTWNGVATSGSDTTLVPAVAGIYTVQGMDGLGCTATSTVSITVNPLPTVTASVSNATPCEFSAVTFNGGGASSYVWSGSVSDNVPAIPTTGTYTVTGTDANSCSNTSTVSVTTSSPISLANATSGNTSSTQGSSSNTQPQVPNGFESYYTSSCELIASVVTSNSFGITEAVVNVENIVPYPVHNGQPFVPRWYQISPTVNGSATVTFYLTQDDFNDYNMYASANGWPLLPTGPTDTVGIANLRVTKNDNTGFGNNPVVLEPTSVIWNATNAYWEVLVTTPSFSQFHFHSLNPSNAALSVTVKDFNGEKMDAFDRLSWTTANEENNDYFNLLYSTNGKDFHLIATVNSKAVNGNSSTDIMYSFDYDGIHSGKNYYKLQQIDMDGKIAYYSKVIVLNRNSSEANIKLYPNPAKDVVNVDWYSAKEQNVFISIKDISGREVKTTQMKSVTGMNTVSIDIQSLSAGIYTVESMVNGQKVQTDKLTIEK